MILFSVLVILSGDGLLFLRAGTVPVHHEDPHHSAGRAGGNSTLHREYRIQRPPGHHPARDLQSKRLMEVIGDFGLAREDRKEMSEDAMVESCGSASFWIWTATNTVLLSSSMRTRKRPRR